MLKHTYTHQTFLLLAKTHKYLKEQEKISLDIAFGCQGEIFTGFYLIVYVWERKHKKKINVRKKVCVCVRVCN